MYYVEINGRRIYMSELESDANQVCEENPGSKVIHVPPKAPKEKRLKPLKNQTRNDGLKRLDAEAAALDRMRFLKVIDVLRIEEFMTPGDGEAEPDHGATDWRDPFSDEAIAMRRYRAKKKALAN